MDDFATFRHTDLDLVQDLVCIYLAQETGLLLLCLGWGRRLLSSIDEVEVLVEGWDGYGVFLGLHGDGAGHGEGSESEEDDGRTHGRLCWALVRHGPSREEKRGLTISKL